MDISTYLVVCIAKRVCNRYGCSGVKFCHRYNDEIPHRYVTRGCPGKCRRRECNRAVNPCLYKRTCHHPPPTGTPSTGRPRNIADVYLPRPSEKAETGARSSMYRPCTRRTIPTPGCFTASASVRSSCEVLRGMVMQISVILFSKVNKWWHMAEGRYVKVTPQHLMSTQHEKALRC